jgi:hypothetical protein
MIQLGQGKVLTIGNKVLFKAVNSLSYRVRGNRFPFSFYAGSSTTLNSIEAFVFYSNKPNSVTVSYGDGVVETYDFVQEVTGIWKFGWRGIANYYGSPQSYDPTIHYFTDGVTAERTISFDFVDLKAIYFNPIQAIRVRKTPIEYLFTSITSIAISLTVEFTDIPIISTNVTTVDFGEQAVETRLLKIPDQWFEAKNMQIFRVRDNYDFTDNISSNLFKINQWKNLTDLRFLGCRITQLPLESINELTNLIILNLEGNRFTAIPPIGSLPNLTQLPMFGNSLISSPVIPIWNFPKLASIQWNFTSSTVRLNYSTIPTSWAGLFSLTSVDAFWRDNAHFNEFIDAFYILVTNGASITAGGAPTPYPNRFRNIFWGKSTLSFTGAKVAPTGYVQGVSNGTPTTQGQKAYVLQTQYNHTITHGTPI